MDNSYIGEIKAFGIHFCPEGWLPCDGAMYKYNEYTSLAYLLGSKFGGDGLTCFSVPDLRGRSPIGSGKGVGMEEVYLGASIGTETTTYIKAHTHKITKIKGNVMASSEGGTQQSPVGNTLAKSTGSNYFNDTPNCEMAKNNIIISNVETESTGVSSVNNVQPSLVLNYFICWDGIFPERQQ